MLTLLKDFCILTDIQTLKDHSSMPKPMGIWREFERRKKVLAEAPELRSWLFILPPP